MNKIVKIFCFSLLIKTCFFLFCLVKSDKQLISNELSSKVGWNSSAFLGPNLWDKDQLYSASGNGLNVNSTTLHNNEKNLNSTTNSNSNFKVENIDIDEFLCENNLNLNDIESFSNHFENVEQPTSNSPNTNQDNLILNSPMQAAPAKSPNDDSISYIKLFFFFFFLIFLFRSSIIKFIKKIFSR
jgi:hypothetical protein